MTKLSVLGINHKTADLSLRSLLALDPSIEVFSHFCGHTHASSVVILSTCNRTEIYSDAPLSKQALIEWMIDFKKVQSSEALLESFYYFEGSQALTHAISVAASLDSLVMGEPQILGQFKKAYKTADENHYVKKKLELFFTTVFQTAKKIRHSTPISRCPVSMAYCALHTFGFERLKATSVLVLGAGEMARKILEHLAQTGVQQVILLNRTLKKAKTLKETFTQRFSDFSLDVEEFTPSTLQRFLDHGSCPIVISTIPQEGVITPALLSKTPPSRPLFFIDLSVPRSIEKEITQFPHVELLDFDEIQHFVERNKAHRSHARTEAEEMIQQAVALYEQKIAARRAIPSIVQLRQHTEIFIQNELNKALQDLQQGKPPEMVLKKLTHRIKQKWLHTPSKKLHSAAQEGKSDLLKLTHEIFDL